MEFEFTTENDKKQCPYCAEIILAKAIKCRYCGEFLNTPKANLLTKSNPPCPDPDTDDDPEFEDADAPLIAVPSLFGIIPTLLRAAFFLAFAAFLMLYPLETWMGNSSPPENTQLQAQQNQAGIIEDITSEINPQLIKKYRTIAGACLTFLVSLIVLFKIIKLKCIRYEITPERIEYSRGILDRKVDNIDMFRVVDISLRRSLLDCIFGIGSINLITTDKTDPNFNFLKIHRPREIYNLIKSASLEADKRNSVIHMEN